MLTTYKKGSEKRLIDLIAKLRDSTAGYYVVHFNFSKLNEHYKNEYQLKISVNIINDILKDGEGYIFIMNDYDIIVFCKNVLPNIVRKVIFQLRYLYMDDPLAYAPETKENPEFCTIYELKMGWSELFKTAKDKMEALEQEVERDNTTHHYKRGNERDGRLTPSKLANVETELGKINLGQIFRSQPICAAKSDGFKVMFSEAYISINALSEQLKTRVDLLSDRILFRYLTQVLDRKMLEYISKNSRKHMTTAISINLNAETLLSETFAEFDKSLDAKAKKNIVIEIHVGDVFTDMQAFVAARTLVQELGYRICLDGLTSLSILQVDRNALGFDLAKIFWNADLKSDARKKQHKELAEAIDRCGASRVILSRCDSQDAVYYGQSLGIGLFQGRYIDSLVNPESDVVN